LRIQVDLCESRCAKESKVRRFWALKVFDPKTWRLYVITNEELSGRSHEWIAAEALKGGADVIQLRDKKASGRRLFEAGREIRRLCREYDRPLIINDRLDIAMVTEADGLHLGQNDLPAEAARKLLGPGRILGVSASSVEEALAAEQAGADYLGVGPIFEARTTKPDAHSPRGPELIRQIRQRVSLPLMAIGGINEDNVEEVMAAGADGVAVISAIVCAADVREATERLRRKILEAWAKYRSERV